MKEDKVVGAVGVFQDISEIEFISSELDSVKELLNEQNIILESVHDGVIILDRYGKVIKANDAFHRILSLNKTPSYYQELLGEYLQESIFSTVRTDQRVTIMEKNKKHLTN